MVVVGMTKRNYVIHCAPYDIKNLVSAMIPGFILSGLSKVGNQKICLSLLYLCLLVIYVFQYNVRNDSYRYINCCTTAVHLAFMLYIIAKNYNLCGNYNRFHCGDENTNTSYTAPRMMFQTRYQQ